MAFPVFEPFRHVASRTIVLPEDDIDTDQILPARFMATTERAGLGGALFYDWRYGGGGEATDHILNAVDPATHRVLVTGGNFGCGSSREHAPWALSDFGIRAIIAPSIADIFYGNAVQNGILPLVVPDMVHSVLIAGSVPVEIDLAAGVLNAKTIGLTHSFTVEPFARQCLLEGSDALGWIAGRMDDIAAFESSR